MKDSNAAVALEEIDQQIEAEIDRRLIGDATPFSNPDEPNRFVPETESAFEWAIRKIKSKKELIAAIDSERKERIALVDAAFKSRLKPEQESEEYLRQIVAEGLHRIGDRKTKTVAGTAFFQTKTPISAPAEDDDRFPNFLKLAKALGVKVSKRPRIDVSKLDDAQYRKLATAAKKLCPESVTEVVDVDVAAVIEKLDVLKDKRGNVRLDESDPTGQRPIVIVVDGDLAGTMIAADTIDASVRETLNVR